MSELVTADPVASAEPPTTGVVARAMSWRALSVVVGQGGWYASLLVLAILVPPGDFGIIAVGSVIASVTTLLISSGTGGSLIIARDLDAGFVRRQAVRTGAIGLAVALLLVATATPIAHHFAKGSDPAALRGLAPVIALGGLFVVPNALLMRQLEFRRIAIVNVAATLVGSAAAITAALLGVDVWALVIRLVLYQALLTGLSWAAAAKLMPRERKPGAPPIRRHGAGAFLAIAVAGFIAWDGDTLVVGASTNATQVGIYAFAFSLAYLPLTQISWNVGSVLLPAVAASRDPEVVRGQALKALRLITLMLLPLVPAVVVLAPGVIPPVLGDKWRDIVTPFQILFAAGIAQGIVNILGEVFAGAGGDSLRRRALVDMVWACGTLGAIAVAVQVDGIDGAAAVHVLTVCCVALAYVFWVARTLELSPLTLGRQLSGVGACVLAQAVVTAAVALGVEAAGGSTLAGGIAGAAAGALVLLLLMRRIAPELIRESRAVVSAVIRRRSAAAA